MYTCRVATATVHGATEPIHPELLKPDCTKPGQLATSGSREGLERGWGWGGGSRSP